MSDSETSDHLEFEAFEALEAMRDMVLPDDGYITRGAQMMEWIRNPNDPTCPGSISMLTWEEIFESADEVDRSVNFTPLASLERDIVLPSQTDFPRQETDYLHWTLTYDSATNYSVGHWEGLTVKGAIVHWGVARSVNGNEVGIPFMSQVSLALYERHHGSTEDLRYVFFCSVINSQTGRFVRGLYSGGPGQPTSEATPRLAQRF
ncbi:hypothetical protein N7470_006103 [Penicillium chermesinum]|nr:hypothetical protein N7470_006103 [Penicillium chermesinum]